MPNFTILDAKKVASLDSKAVSTTPKSYPVINADSYYLLLNTWTPQFDIIDQGMGAGMRNLLKTRGLLPVVADCNDAANAIISERFEDVPTWLNRFLDASIPLCVRLQVLRYAKRFSPLDADKLTTQALSNFKVLNNDVKLQQRAECPLWLTGEMKVHIHDMLKGFSVDYTRGIFSNGSAADSSRPLASKLQAISEVIPYLYTPMYPISKHADITEWHRGYTSHVMAVPKSYKTARIIASEHSYRQFRMQAIRVAFEDCLSRNGYTGMLDLHDQEPNRELCKLGSMFGNYATIDLSSASDSIARSLVRETFPSNVVREMWRWLPHQFEIDGKASTMHMFCTSGSALTFPVESMVFLAIALSAGEIVRRTTGLVSYPPHIFGDDMVVDVRLYDTICDFLRMLGFKVNDDKSFAVGQYRESCGVEYHDGESTATIYFPRKQLQVADGAPFWESIISLQHRAWGLPIECRLEITSFLSDYVRQVYPDMTSSIIEDDTASDLWDTIPYYKVTAAPSAKNTWGKDPHDIPWYAQRERHYAIVPVKDKEPVPAVSKRLLDLWNYTTFLRLGPAYPDAISRLLRVSDATPSYQSQARNPELAIRLITK